MPAHHGPGKQMFAIMYPHKEKGLLTTWTPWASPTRFASFSATDLQLYHTTKAHTYYPHRRIGCFMIFLIWQQPDSPYGSSTRLHREDSTTAKLVPLLHPLLSEKMKVFINDKERLVQAICTRASFTRYLAAAYPCTIQPAKCSLFYIYIHTSLIT